MANESPPTGSTPTPLPLPAVTLVVGQNGEVLLVIEGALVLPLGSRIQLSAEGTDAAVVGIRLVGTAAGPLHLMLEVDSGGSSFDPAALAEALAEAEVVEAAEEIAGIPLDDLPDPDIPPTPDPVG